MKIETRGPDGSPICPICGTGVTNAGAFCSPSCYQHFCQVVSQQSGILDMESHLDHTDHEWFSEGAEDEPDM